MSTAHFFINIYGVFFFTETIWGTPNRIRGKTFYIISMPASWHGDYTECFSKTKSQNTMYLDGFYDSWLKFLTR